MSITPPISLPRHPARLATACLVMIFMLFALPLAADENEDDENVWFPRTALRVFDCDEGEDCAQLWHLGMAGGFLGVSTQQLTPALREHFGAPPDAGVLIGQIVEGSPAEEAGLLVGDVIVAIDGEAVGSSGRLGRMIRQRDDGAAADIEVIRDGKALVLRATIRHRERTTVELSDFIDATVFETLDALDLEKIGESLGDLSFGEMSFGELGEGKLGVTLEAIGEAFESDAWKGYVQRLEEMDFSQLEERMKELQERMRELEEKLEKRDD